MKSNMEFISYDLVVIGGGAAGISGAISAYDSGVKNILIIDREDNLGGVLNELIESGYGYTTLVFYQYEKKE